MTKDYLAWLDCECDVCKAISDAAHDKPAYDALFENTIDKCPRYSASRTAAPPRCVETRFGEYEDCDPPAEPDTLSDRQLTLAGI